MNVLVIPEDFRKDQFILKPLIKGLMGRRATVRVCQNPLLGGVGEALKPARLREIVERYEGMYAVFILCVDRDGKTGRRQRLDQIESEFGVGRTFFAENAWEEVETWVLAGLDLPRGWRWSAVRAEVDVKETYFEPLVRQRGVAEGPGGGRKALAEEAVRNILAIRQKCREDFGVLAGRLASLS